MRTLEKGSIVKLIDRAGADIPEHAGDTATVLGGRWPRVSIRVGKYVAVVSRGQLQQGKQS